jgi:hypothetical protein
MARYGYGGYGATISRQVEQERIGYGPQGYVVSVLFDESISLLL